MAALPAPAVDIETFLDLEDWDDRDNFWSSYRNFFKDQGYTLFELKKTARGSEYYVPIYEPLPSESHIYATFSQCISSDLRAIVPRRHIMYAQDEQKRAVVIKLVQTDSVEHCIHQRLMSYAEFNHPESFPFVIPTLEILSSPHNFSFVITPRWGTGHKVPYFRSARELLSFTVNILQGLHFLHSRRIVHLDIDDRNILINHYTYNISSGPWDEEGRAHLRAEDQARYCLFDFDLSQIFPLDTSVTECRLPIASVKGRGAPWLHPNEVNSAEPDLDPFKFDVACMGKMLSDFYSYMIPALPLFAPLLDRMTTDDAANRFTAFHALSFCQFIQNSLTPIELEEQLPPRPSGNSHSAWSVGVASYEFYRKMVDRRMGLGSSVFLSFAFFD